MGKNIKKSCFDYFTLRPGLVPVPDQRVIKLGCTFLDLRLYLKCCVIVNVSFKAHCCLPTGGNIRAQPVPAVAAGGADHLGAPGPARAGAATPESSSGTAGHHAHL